MLMMLDLLGEIGQDPRRPGNGDAELWRYVGLRVPQLVAALPALRGAARHADRLRRPQPEQRGRRDEGGGHVRPPDPRAADPRQPARRRGGLSPSTRRSSTRATRPLTAWNGADYGPVPPDSGISSNVWVAQWRRSDPRRPRRRARRGVRARRRHALRRASGETLAAHHDRRTGARRARRRLAACSTRKVYDTATNVVQQARHARSRSARSRAATVHARQGQCRTRRISDACNEAIIEPRPRRPPDRRSAQRLVAQDQRAAVGRADAVARRGSRRSASRARARC